MVDIVDSHMHLWDRGLHPYPWLDNEPDLPYTYLLNDYLAESEKYKITRAVHVQAGIDRPLSVEETAWVSQLSREFNFPLSIVGYLDLTQNNPEETLEKHLKYPEFKGIRQILSDEVDYLSHPNFAQNLKVLSKYNLSFDLQIHPEQMDLAAQVFAEFEGPVILNHLGLPKSLDSEYHAYWLSCLDSFLPASNFYLKLSGLGMFNPEWKATTALPFVESALNLFGADHCMFASNFPVEKPSKSFDEVYDQFFDLTQALALNENEISRLFFETAVEVYF